jgi:hypothetical protein
MTCLRNHPAFATLDRGTLWQISVKITTFGGGCDAVWACKNITFQRKFQSSKPPWKWRQFVSPKRGYLPTSLHGVTTQTNDNVTFIAAETSNLFSKNNLPPGRDFKLWDSESNEVLTTAHPPPNVYRIDCLWAGPITVAVYITPLPGVEYFRLSQGK